MAPFPRQLRLARILLILGALLLVTAQFLPWEHIVVNHDYFIPQATTRFSQMPHVHHVWLSFPTNDIIDSPRTLEPHRPPRLVTADICPEGYPNRISIHHLPDLWAYGRALNSDILRRWNLGWPLLDLAVWTIALPSLLALPFFAGLFARARPLLWLTRFFACCLLIWLVRNLVLVTTGYPDASLKNIGSGYWMTLDALAMEITALFLIPNAAKHHLRQTS
ncbi:hypothetical protein KBB96_03505 [Luteolibacter ambystomatis]|uniref:Uncharacterized protein n=1 Tax=Luteolibacter ambystomatis TaxID=2824561 RepID=A0A975J0V0_9BACT|nr:hypothetical protein [Luteolibacter ambystomatis]QUE51960.1 hypothetical protein KBB96_03505 [Luteolibacter ambystomatis]